MPATPSCLLISHPACLDHDTGGGLHPEVPARQEVIRQRLQSGILARTLAEFQPEPPGLNWLLNIHQAEYLMRFEETVLVGKSFLDHRDNQLCWQSYEAALYAAGNGLKGIDLVEAQGKGQVFCCVRPPGHHAERSLAMGFCFLNNTAIAARYWQERYGRKRIMVIDWDAHHGNGIQSAFIDDPDIFYVSLHEHPTFSFPGSGFAEETGIGPGQGATLNIPLPPGSGDDVFLKAFAAKVEPAVARFAPEALVVAAGFDGHRLDDMSGLAYSTGLYHRLGILMAGIGAQYCQGRVVSILEGGYHLGALAESVEAYIAGLAGLAVTENGGP